MFGRVIWDKLPKFIFVNFGIARVKRGQLKIFFENHESDLSKSRANQTCDYWLITPNQQTLYIDCMFLSCHVHVSEWIHTL